MALALIVSHLIIGIIVPRFFATGVRNLGPAIRGAQKTSDIQTSSGYALLHKHLNPLMECLSEKSCLTSILPL